MKFLAIIKFYDPTIMQSRISQLAECKTSLLAFFFSESLNFLLLPVANVMDMLIDATRQPVPRIETEDGWFANVSTIQPDRIVKSVYHSTMINHGDGPPRRTHMLADVSESTKTNL